MSNRRPTFTDFDRSYRRGVVLGLSLAEVFIILIFLLLLAMIGYAASKEQELETFEEELANAEKSSAEAEHAANVLRDRLADVRETLDLVEKERTESQERADDAEQQPGNPIENDDPNVLISALNVKIENLTNDKEELQDKLTATAPDTELGKRVQEIADELGVDPNELIAATENITTWKGDIDRLNKENEQLRKTLPQKGQDSPCWWKKATRINGEDYEKPLYIFNVRITDNYIFVGDIPAPPAPGIVTDAYKTQKKQLQFDRAALNRELKYEQFVPAFQSLKAAGENKEVRNDRRCTFYVRVWDAIGESNKTGYERAYEQTVQAVFGTYKVSRDEWPH